MKTRFSLAKEIKGGFYRAVSPDAKKICVCFTNRPIGKVTLRSSGSQRTATRNGRGPDRLAVIELGSWKEIYSLPLLGESHSFSFFPDSETLYGETEPVPLTFESILIKLRTGSVERRRDEYDPKATLFAEALKDHILIGTRGTRLVQVEWPSFREILGVDVGEPRFIHLSDDRSRLIHMVGQALVCRRVDDFTVLWTREIDSEIDLAYRGVAGISYASANVGIAGDGNTVVLAARRAAYEGRPEKVYVEILDGKNGKPVSRWPKDGHDGVALSPDGRMLAIATLDGKDGYLEPGMRIHEVASGREITSVVHDRIPSEQRLAGSLNGSGSGFTPDGKYLITSNSLNVKIWQVTGG